jgi:hypothetical protein
VTPDSPASSERERLLKASNDVFYLITQVFSYYSWHGHLAIRWKPTTPGRYDHSHTLFVQNAVNESHLMYIRKLNEFFYPRPKLEKHPDDLRAYKFGFTELGPFMNEHDMEVLHKRVAHPTFMQADQGSATYPAYTLSHAALNHALAFLHFLRINLLKDQPDKREHADQSIRFIHEIWNEWSSALPQNLRQDLSR